MAKIICATSGLTGILNASFELVARLENAGHTVIYTSPKSIGEKIRRQGIPFVQLPEIKTNEEEKLPPFKGRLRQVKRWRYKFENATERRQKALAAIEPIAFEKLIEEEQPDLLIIDIELHEYIFKASGRKLPTLLLSQWFSLWNRPGLPYLLHDTIPGKGWRGQRWAIYFSWQWIKMKRWLTFSKQQFLSVGTDRRSSLLALAKKESFPTQLIKENYWPGPFTYDQLPVLSMTNKEMEFPHPLRPNLHYIGAMVCESRKETPLEEKEKSKLRAALQYKSTNAAALIYCSVSTLHPGDHHFIKKIIAAVSTQKKWMLIIGLGGLIEQSSFQGLPDNVFAFKRVPQLQILKAAACSINHGGIHTINECIHFKVPMLIYSGKRSDQNGCAARVDFHQLGLMADKDLDGPKEITNKITAVLTKPVFRKNINEMHLHYLRYKEDAVLEKIIRVYV